LPSTTTSALLDQGKGIDVELAEALGKQLGLAQVVGYNADEDMDDDLRNMVWKGHYLGAQPSDVMMHVPVDSYLQGKNDKVKIFGPYHLETIAVARVQRIGRSAARRPRAGSLHPREDRRRRPHPGRRLPARRAQRPPARERGALPAWPPPSTS
jgi:hypothetical protein